MTQEALKLALETLEKLACLGNGQTYGNSIGNNIAMNAITAIKKALAQEQEPVADDFFRMIADRNPKPFSSLQHTWVDLTRTQMQDVYFEVLKEHRGGHQMEGQLAFGEALQAKLKERNT